ncbi:YpsA SLOG family protein [uncultured Corynebacterium sp.]|uniref:YpsA SLOG family protein n=1 Tax=uncultured Corynebacterium sp. TaxID=159447 RepID=UPI00345C5924
MTVPSLIAAIRSGGQTGVDRGAPDAACEAGVRIGTVPGRRVGGGSPRRTGSALRPPRAPGDTPSPEQSQRTVWNVRDSHVPLLIVTEYAATADAASPGTALTRDLRGGAQYRGGAPGAQLCPPSTRA